MYCMRQLCPVLHMEIRGLFACRNNQAGGIHLACLFPSIPSYLFLYLLSSPFAPLSPAPSGLPQQALFPTVQPSIFHLLNRRLPDLSSAQSPRLIIFVPIIRHKSGSIQDQHRCQAKRIWRIKRGAIKTDMATPTLDNKNSPVRALEDFM